MALYEDMAKSMLDTNREKIMSLPENERKAFIDSIINDLSQNPSLNAENATVTPTTQANLVNLEKQHELDKEQWLASGGSEKAIPESSELQLNRRNAELESQGVATDRELPAGSLEIGFGDRELRSVRGALSKHFGKKVPVFKSGEDIIYIDPADNRPVKANPNFSAAVGQSIPVVSEIGAAFIGSKGAGSIPKMVAKESAVAGAASGVGELVRLSLGKAMGAHDMEMPEIIAKSAVRGGWSAGTTMGVGTLIASAKGLSNFRTGKIFNKEDALDAGVPVKDADEVVAEANKLLPKDKQFKPTLAQKGDDTLTESAEAELRGRSEYAQRFREADVVNIEAEKAAVERMGAPEIKPYTPATVSEVAEREVAKDIAAQTAPVKASQIELKSQLDEIGKVQKEGVGKDTISVIKAKDKAASDAIDAQWNDVRATGGYDEKTKLFNIDIPPQAPTKDLEKILQRQSRAARTGEGATATKDFFNKSKPADLGDFQSEISRLKARLRKMKRGTQASDRDAADVGEVIRAMEQDRNLALVKAGKTDLLEKIKAAEVETAKYHDTYKRSVIGDLTEQTPNGTPKIKSQTFVDDVMKRDDAEIDDFFEVIGDNPDLKMKWKQGIGDKYKREVFKEGKEGVETYSHRANVEFLKRNEYALKKVFTDKELKGFLNTGKLHEKVANQTKALDKYIKDAETKWGAGKLSKLDPDNMVKFVTNDSGSWITPKGQGVQSSLKKIKFVKNLVKNDKGAWQGFQNDFKKSLQNDITNVKTGRIDSKKLSEWTSSANKDKVIEVMGKNYYDDLVKIDKVIKMVNKPMKKLAAEESRLAWTQAIRAGAAPPLTRRGRAFTALLMFDKKMHHKATIDALLDQKTMHEVAKLAEHDVVTRRVMEKAFSLGLGIQDEQEE
jgi:hypothetical protein